MMARMQVALDPEIHRRARQRALDLGISFAEYIRRLVAEDVGRPRSVASPSVVFNLGSSGGSDVAAEKDSMVGDAIASRRAGSRRRDAE